MVFEGLPSEQVHDEPHCVRDEEKRRTLEVAEEGRERAGEVEVLPAKEPLHSRFLLPGALGRRQVGLHNTQREKA